MRLLCEREKHLYLVILDPGRRGAKTRNAEPPASSFERYPSRLHFGSISLLFNLQKCLGLSSAWQTSVTLPDAEQQQILSCLVAQLRNPCAYLGKQRDVHWMPQNQIHFQQHI